MQGGNQGPNLGGRPGEVLAPILRDAINLTPEQRQQIDQLQQEVNDKLGQILTEQQQQQLRQIGDRVQGGNAQGGGNQFGGQGANRLQQQQQQPQAQQQQQRQQKPRK